MKGYLRILREIRGRAAKTAAVLLAVLVCAQALPLVSLAAKGAVEFEEGQGKALVSIVLEGDEGAKKGATSLELGLKDTSGEMAELAVSFAFDEGLSRGRVAEFRYHPDTGILNLYVAGETPLFAEDSAALTLGTATVEGGMAGINVVENSLKLSGSGMAIGNVTIQALAEDVPLVDTAAGGLVDRSRLEEILRKAAEYREADYTPESYAILAEAIKTAQAVLDKADATQEEIDEAVLLVENAIGSLVEKDTPASGGNQNGGDQNGGNPGGGNQNGGNQNDGAAVKPPLKTTDTTDTGDKTSVLPYVLAAAASAAVLGGIVFLQRKRSGKSRRPEK